MARDGSDGKRATRRFFGGGDTRGTHSLPQLTRPDAYLRRAQPNCDRADGSVGRGSAPTAGDRSRAVVARSTCGLVLVDDGTPGTHGGRLCGRLWAV